MTQAMHNIIGFTLAMLTWFLFFKPYFIRNEEKDRWDKWLDDNLFN